MTLDYVYKKVTDFMADIQSINLYEIERSAVVQDIANAMRRYNISAKDIETLIA